MILIIGASGFIGSHLDDYFTSKGKKVFRCDVRPRPGTDQFATVDKLNPEYGPVILKCQPDVCIYAGGNGNVSVSIQDPALDYLLNTTDVSKILFALKEHKPDCKFIHISSAAVYGNPVSLPIKEMDAILPLSPYGWHKYMTELLCKEFFILFQIPTVSLRVFSVYGERLKKQLFWDTYRKFKEQSTVELFGTGKETRDFIYISDLVRAFDLVIQKAEFVGEAINVSSGIETTIEEAATLFGQMYNPSKKIVFNHQSKPGDPANWRADISSIHSLGFAAQIKIEDGLKNYVKWLKENE